MNKADALAAIAEIKSLSKGFGCVDTTALRKINALVYSLKCAGPNDSYYIEKLSSIQNWSQVGFSTRKFEKHGGADQVRVFVLGDCMTLKGLIEESWPGGV